MGTNEHTGRAAAAPNPAPYGLNLTHEVPLPHMYLYLAAVLFGPRADTFEVGR